MEEIGKGDPVRVPNSTLVYEVIKIEEGRVYLKDEGGIVGLVIVPKKSVVKVIKNEEM